MNLIPREEYQPELRSEIVYVAFVQKVGDKYEVLGRAWSKRDSIRFMVGWEVKDCFDKAVGVDRFKFAQVKEIIPKDPFYVFVIKPE